MRFGGASAPVFLGYQCPVTAAASRAPSASHAIASRPGLDDRSPGICRLRRRRGRSGWPDQSQLWWLTGARGPPAPVAAVRHLSRAARERLNIPAAYTTIAVMTPIQQPGLHPGQPALRAGRLPSRADRRDHDDKEDEEEGVDVAADRVRGAVLAAHRRPGGARRSRLRQVIEQPAQVPAGLGVHRLRDALVELGLVEPTFGEVGGQTVGHLGDVRRLRRGCAGRYSRSGTAGQDHAAGTGWTKLA